jgi:acyl transferase domain-containing protein
MCQIISRGIELVRKTSWQTIRFSLSRYHQFGSKKTNEGEIALFALQYALSKTWKHWGVEPSSSTGLGVGEITAACVSGVISLKDSLAILLARQEVILKEENLVSCS